jgi:hypothetical protein
MTNKTNMNKQQLCEVAATSVLQNI